VGVLIGTIVVNGLAGVATISFDGFRSVVALHPGRVLKLAPFASS
jgi:hypothetical protein